MNYSVKLHRSARPRKDTGHDINPRGRTSAGWGWWQRSECRTASKGRIYQR